ncbi:MAG: DUF3293 domain-containing protein [Gemmatimonadaceae bacterium]|nr:DUF3293 domain-containing protein [Gemmatimonadaceae bacterium]
MTEPTTDPGGTGAESLVDEKWSQYPRTILEFLAPGAPRIDLRKPLGPREHALLRDLRLDRAFAVLTAENPWGENAEDEPTGAAEDVAERRNATRRERLERELREAHVAFVRCDGVAPEGDYREHGVAALVERETAVAMARRYRQLAIFWFDGEQFWLIGAVADKPPERLPA